LKRKRVEVSEELLEILSFEERILFHTVTTGGESRFYLDCSNDHIWARAADDVPQRVSHEIQSEKLMLTVSSRLGDRLLCNGWNDLTVSVPRISLTKLFMT
jgi:hypothetical protein